MGEAELGRIDIPMRDKSVKKSFQTLHTISPFLTYSPEIDLMDVMRFSGKAVRLVDGWLDSVSPNHFPINAQSEKKKDQPVLDEVAEKVGLTFKHYNGMTVKFLLPEIIE